MRKFSVVLAEFSSCMGGDEREVDSVYDDYEAAVRRCRELVEQSLRSLATTATSEEDLFDRYLAVGPEPFIDPSGDRPFLARSYARELCRRMFDSSKR